MREQLLVVRADIRFIDEAMSTHNRRCGAAFAPQHPAKILK